FRLDQSLGLQGLFSCAFDVHHTVDAAERLHHALEVLDVADLDRDVDPRAAVVVGVGFHVADVGVDVGDLGADRCHQPLPAEHLHRQLHGVGRGGFAGVSLVPFDVDTALGVVEQVDDVRTGGRVDRDALAAGDVANDFLASNGIAAARAKDHQVVDAADLDLFF